MKHFRPFLFFVAVALGAQTQVDYPTQIKNGPVFSDAGPVGSTLQSLCTKVGSGTLAITKRWTALPTQIVSCNLLGYGGVIQPASGQTVTISAYVGANPYQQIFDLSLGGSVVVNNPPPLSIGWFGAKPDANSTGTSGTDNSAFINSAIVTAAASNSGGGNVMVPNGNWGTASTLNMHTNVNFVGEGIQSNIVALSTFSPSTGAPVVSGGGSGCSVVANSMLENVSINVAGHADGGILANCWQEHSGTLNAQVINWNLYGIQVATGFSQQFSIEQTTTYPAEMASPVSAAKAIWINNIGGTARIASVTATGNINLSGGGVNSGTCFDIFANSVVLEAVHGEGCADIVKIEASSTVNIVSVFGGPTTGSCTNVVHFTSTAQTGSSITNSYINGCSHAIVDDRLGKTFDFGVSGFNYIDGPLNIDGGFNVWNGSGSITGSLSVFGGQTASCPSGSVLCVFGNATGPVGYFSNTGARASTAGESILLAQQVNNTDAGLVAQFPSQGAAATQGINTSLSTPANSSVTCAAGQIWADAGYVYVCTATNTVKRTALSTF